MLNRVVLVGRITKDPEVRMTGSNIAVCSFTIAVNRQFADANGTRQADFINCVVWRAQAENLGKFVKKGSLLGIDGKLQTRSYESETGTKYITEVVCDSIQFLESKNDNSEHVNNANTEESYFSSSKKIEISEEDLPF